MSGSNPLLAKVLNNVFPRVPDFFGLINDQVAVLTTMGQLFEEFMETNNPDIALKIRELEHKGDELKARNMNVLADAFATPMDREDIYRAISSVDMVMNYLKTTVREIETLGLTPDEHTLHMSQIIREGVDSLARGYEKLKIQPALAEADAAAVHKSERSVEKTYRRALAMLLSTEEQMKNLSKDSSVESVITVVMTAMKRRELYRHISNTADELAKAGDVLHDIVVQIS
jgi:uncharacterized protein Yka (UPF0111/DUF47 family)